MILKLPFVYLNMVFYIKVGDENFARFSKARVRGAENCSGCCPTVFSESCSGDVWEHSKLLHVPPVFFELLFQIQFLRKWH